MSAVKVSSPMPKAESLTVFPSDVSMQKMRVFIGHNPNRNDKGYVYGALMLISGLDSWKRAVMRC